MSNMENLTQHTKGHMSDADRLMDCCCSAKELAMHYAQAALESTNNGVREFFLAMHGEETHNQEILFSFLHTRGLYPVKMESEENIQAVRQRYQQVHEAMGLTDHPSTRRYKTADPHLPPAHVQDPTRFDYKDTH
ncbi:MAG: spore coat protein [Mycobacterium leprae]